MSSTAVDVAVEDDSDDVRWVLRPDRGIDPKSATAVNSQSARFIFSVPRWGRRKVGSVDLVVHDRWRLAEGRLSLTLPSVDCYPRPAVQRTQVVLSRLPNRLGEHPARMAGEGTEFTGVRNYVPGDRQRAINWPATTRRGRLQVNTFAAERSQDVVLLVDATSDVGEPGSSALDLGLRGAAGAARAYLDERDRVGVITYQWGGAVWLAPSLGRRQVYRIIDTMLSADAAWARGAVVPAAAPRRTAPRGAGRGVQPAAGPAIRRGAAGHARTRLLAHRRGRAERRAAGEVLVRGQGGPPHVADGAAARSASRCASSACPSCTGTVSRRWTCRWPRTPGGPWWCADEVDSGHRSRQPGHARRRGSGGRGPGRRGRGRRRAAAGRHPAGCGLRGLDRDLVAARRLAPLRADGVDRRGDRRRVAAGPDRPPAAGERLLPGQAAL